MKIGEKIKKLRIDKSMTQSELAGNFITRNMLSLIESGSAQPSLPTVEYLASRLNVPLGILVSDDNGEYFYRRMNEIENIKRTFKNKNYRISLSLCQNLKENTLDDELGLIMSECYLGIAKEEFCDGHLRSSCEMFDKAVESTQYTCYNTLHIKSEALVYYTYMHEISPTLYCENIEGLKAPVGASFQDDFCKYTILINSKATSSEESFSNNLYNLLFNIKINIREKQFETAMHDILDILHGSENVPTPLMYDMFCELEVCCRETRDFEGAYKYSSTKVVMLEKLLSEEYVDD